MINQVDQLLKTLPLDKKVALLQSAGWFGNAPLRHEAARNLLFNQGIGAFTLYDYNLGTAQDSAQMVKEIMGEAKKQGKRFPIFNIDAEGGRLYTNVKGATMVPGNMALGAIATADLTRAVRLAYEQGRMIARELKSWGVTWALAPVIDVNSNPMNPVIGIRSVGEDKKTVAEVTSALIRGFQEEGVAATVKHVPDHGDTAFDTHTEMSIDLRRREDIRGIYVLQKAIEANVAAIMPSHMAYPRAFPDPKGPKIKVTIPDPKDPMKPIGMEVTPATLSSAILTDFFRRTLGFQGLIITDALEMGAIIDHFGIGYAALLALEAGADVFIAGADPVILEKIWQEKFNRSYTQEDQLEPQRVIIRAAKEGIVTKVHKNSHGEWVSVKVPLSTERWQAILERIDESARRVLTFQMKWGLRRPPDPIRANVIVGSKEHQKLSEKIAEGAVTLLKASRGESFKNLSPTSEIVVVRPQYEQLTPADSAYKLGFTLLEKIKKYHPYTHGVVVLKPLPKRETLLKRDSRLHAEQVLVGEKREDVQVVRGIQSVLEQVKEADVLVIETYFGHQSDFQRSLLESLLKTGKRVVHLIVGNPYDAMISTQQADVIMIGYSPRATEAMIKVLFEEILPKGRLPITIPHVAKRGDGLAQFPLKTAIAFESYREHIPQLATAALVVSLLAFPLVTTFSPKTQISQVQSVLKLNEHTTAKKIKVLDVNDDRMLSYFTINMNYENASKTIPLEVVIQHYLREEPVIRVFQSEALSDSHEAIEGLVSEREFIGASFGTRESGVRDVIVMSKPVKGDFFETINKALSPSHFSLILQDNQAAIPQTVQALKENFGDTLRIVLIGSRSWSESIETFLKEFGSIEVLKVVATDGELSTEADPTQIVQGVDPTQSLAAFLKGRRGLIAYHQPPQGGRIRQ